MIDVPLVRRVVVLETTGSTNDDARRLAQEGAPEGTVVLARSQTAGRGRLGRSWHSPEGSGLYLSILLRPVEPLDRIGRYSIVLALAALSACRAAGAEAARIKWPNDVLVERRKVAGVLAELRSGIGGAELVAGFGINLGPPAGGYPAELAGRATSLADASGRAPSFEQTAEGLLRALDHWVACLRGGGWDEVRDAFVRYAPSVQGANVTLRGGAAGTTRGLDDAGALLVATASGLVSVHGGESLESWEA